MMQLAPYPEYRDSGVLWLSTIPVGWKIERAKNLFSESNLPVRESDEIVTCFRDGQVTLRKNRRERGFMNAFLEVGYQGVRANQLVVHAMDAFAGAIGVSDSDGKCTPEYVVLNARSPEINLHFYALVLREMARLDYIKVICPAVRERAPRLRYPNLASMYLPVPGIEFQNRIVSFSHKSKNRIGKFIRNKRRLIELLKEQVENLAFGGKDNSLISDYTDWKTLFPIHWGFQKAKRVFTESVIKNTVDKELLAVTQDRGVLLKSMCAQNYVSPAGSLEALKLVENNDFVISLRSFQGGIEFSEFEGIVSPAYTVLKLKEAFRSQSLRTFYRVLFKTANFIKLLNTAISGIRDGKNISYADFAELEIPVPPMAELADLLQFFKDYQSFREISGREIELIREYRTRLISDVVTGKVDVRGIVVPEVAEEELLELDEDAAEEDNVIDDEGDMDEAE